MDAALWSSARDILVELGGNALPEDMGRMPASAADYGAYSDLVLPLPKEMLLSVELRAEAEAHLRGRLAANVQTREPDAVSRPPISNFDAASYPSEHLMRLNRWWDIEPANPMGLSGVPEEEFHEARQRAVRALDVLERAAPELFEEIAAIVNEIVLVSPDGSQSFDFLGGSSFALWGAIFINVDLNSNWPFHCKTIVHEAGHNLLFAVAREEPLVLNDPSASFASPVREDPRPIDGIFHAAFVTARESLAIDRILSWHDETGSLSQDEVEQLGDILEGSVIAFWQCVERLGKNATLSDLGRAIIRDCEDYMTRNFALVTQ